VEVRQIHLFQGAEKIYVEPSLYSLNHRCSTFRQLLPNDVIGVHFVPDAVPFQQRANIPLRNLASHTIARAI
jgi:hypothetical protein